MSTADQALSSTLHGTALLLAQDDILQPLVHRLTTMAGDRPDLRAEVAGSLTGRWFADPETHAGYDLIAAGFTILAGEIERRDVARWLRSGYAFESIGNAAVEALAGDAGSTGNDPAARVKLLAASSLLLATDESLQPLLDRIRTIASDRPDIRAEVAGTIAGYWFSAPDSHQGHELVAAGLTLVAGTVDGAAVARWVRVGYQRGTDATTSYDPTR